ncbi:Histidine kinase [Mucilaginibacter mallensis]|uniref:Histidine kinase n=1 Tax=Mucilaginibacter mallensis TaxID=652787 RepID=A0A1H1XZH8_MUCMA|nr:histidine kinase [Mucilaginibacter mallensis]SDT14593.1 Histidine kinase [Mucilaginibacter mallensis]
MKKLEIWLKRYRLHFLIWALYIAYECIMVALVYGDIAKPLVYVTHYIIILCLFYSHANLAFAWALQNKLTAIWKLPLVILVEVGVYLLCSYVNDFVLEKFHIIAVGSLHFSDQYVIRNGYRCLFFVGFSSGYYFLKTYSKERIKTAILERQRLNEIISRHKAEQDLTKAQNAFLKAQINPHFLFNTLDFIYHHIISVSPVAADAVITLAEMMRFAIDADKVGEYIKLGDEIDQVNNLRYLSVLRKNEELPFSFAYEPDIRELNFIPLVLLTLAENIFKHGDLSKGQAASLEVYLNDSLLIIESDNVSSRSQHNSHGTGLLNIEKRLKYAYGDAVDFNYSQHNDGHFRVIIKIPVQLLHENARTLPFSTGIDKEWPHEHVDPR